MVKSLGDLIGYIFKQEIENIGIIQKKSSKATLSIRNILRINGDRVHGTNTSASYHAR